MIDEHNIAWQAWFHEVGVQPFSVEYEELEADPVGVTRDVLKFLKLELPSKRHILVRNRGLADDLNAEWIARYQTEMAGS